MKMLSAGTIMVVVAMLSLTVSSVKSNELEVRKDLQTPFSTVTLDLSGPENTWGNHYRAFLKDLRNEVKAETLVCGLPTTNGKPTEDKKYVHVKIMISKVPQQWVTLGLDVMDLYVVGYTDNVIYQDPKTKERGHRSNFLFGTPDAVKERIFAKKNIRRVTKFSCNYASLEKYSGKRVDLQLKLKLLKETILDVYGKQQPDDKKEAKFVLVAIQIVSEAARFKFMEEAIVDVAAASNREFRRKMVAFQNEWNAISKSIHDSKGPCKDLNPQQKINGNVYKTLNDIKDDMAMLKFKRIKRETALSDADDVFVDDHQNLHLDA